MMYMTKVIVKENIVSMYDERCAELEALLEASDERYLEYEKQLSYEIKQRDLLNTKYSTDTSILASILHYVMETCGPEKHHLAAAMDSLPYSQREMYDVLMYHEAVPSDMLVREYSVTVTVPVSVSFTVEAMDEDEAEEKAISALEGDGLEYYAMDYNLCYNAEFEIEEN